jgi:hypothetical protein
MPTVNVSTPAESDRDDLRRMAPTYIGVIVVEIVTLLALWWFQSAFGA